MKPVAMRRVRLRYTFEIEADVPDDWDAEMIEFHRNDGSWCANNSIDELKAAKADGDCLCRRFKAEYLGPAESDDEV